MKKIYLVDSENVGDVWVPLLVSSQPEDEMLVFYTTKSPHMNYENVRMLKETEREATFIKCFEGSNALDFQLVSELGYRLKENEDCAYVVVSNDTGFDAVVRYWSAKKQPVSRMSGKECIRLTSAKTETKGTKKESQTLDAGISEKEQLNDTPVVETEGTGVPEILETEIQEIDKVQQMIENPKMVEDFIKRLCCCFNKDRLADFHNALVTLLGDTEGKALYQKIKTTPEWNAYLAEIPESEPQEKFDIYCKLVFEISELAEEYPEDFSSFLFKANGKRQNLNSLRAALQGHYGKEKGMKYYSLIKSHIKIMNHM